MGEELMTMTYEPLSTGRGCGCGAGCGCSGGTTCASCSWAGENALYGLERTRFYPRQIVTPDDLTQDQIYFGDRFRRHNRLLHGWGLVCGVVVERCGGPDPATFDPCKVKITSGYALDPYGNEIVVSSAQVVDLCKEDMIGALACLPHDDPWCRPVDAPRTGTYYLAVRFRERAIKPVHAPTGCSCKDTSCENSRYRDEYEFSLLTELPDHYAEPCDTDFDPCAAVDHCPSCPTSGWVVVATITMVASAIQSIGEENRRHVLSLSAVCFDCSRVRGSSQEFALARVAKPLFATATATPDTFVKVPVVVDGYRSDVVIAVANADLAGKTAMALASEWSKVPVFDTNNPATPVFDASWLLAHSPMKGSWTIESADDLRARLGTPVIDTKTYPQRRKAVEDLLDLQGRVFFHDTLLDNVSRLDEINVEKLTGVSAASAASLGLIGIHSLDDVRTSNLDNPLIPPNAKPKLVAARDVVSWT